MKKIKLGQIGIGHNHGAPKMLATRKLSELFEVVGYSEENPRWVEKRGTPVKVSVDCLSGETLGKSLPYMARGDYWIVISTLAGVEIKVLLRPLLTKGLHLVGSMLRNRTPEFKAYILLELVKNV